MTTPRSDPVTLIPRLTACLFALCLGLLPARATWAQAMPGVSSLPSPASQYGESSAQGGWDGLARLLEALKPGVDTEIAPTPSQITDRIEALLNAGQNRAALALIQERLAEDVQRHTPGADVQLAFLHARALAATGDPEQAERIYDELTTTYPELPEPWNNLAALYTQRGQLDRAQQALQTAILIDPKYGMAYANLGQIQLMLARLTYQTAAQLGMSGARSRALSIGQLLEQ